MPNSALPKPVLPNGGHDVQRALASVAITLMVGATFASTAHADMVFRFHNLSNVEAKGIMHNVGTVWLRRGQVEIVRHEGSWTQFGAWGEYCIPSVTCKTLLHAEYIAIFRHLQDANTQEYCKWAIKRDIVTTNKSPTYPNEVRLTVNLVGQSPGYSCGHSGQFVARHSTTHVGEGLTLDFSVKNN